MTLAHIFFSLQKNTVNNRRVSSTGLRYYYQDTLCPSKRDETENELLQAPTRAEMYRRISDREPTTVLKVLRGLENDTETNNGHHMNRQSRRALHNTYPTMIQRRYHMALLFFIIILVNGDVISCFSSRFRVHGGGFACKVTFKYEKYRKHYSEWVWVFLSFTIVGWKYSTMWNSVTVVWRRVSIIRDYGGYADGNMWRGAHCCKATTLFMSSCRTTAQVSSVDYVSVSVSMSVHCMEKVYVAFTTTGSEYCYVHYAMIVSWGLRLYPLGDNQRRLTKKNQTRPSDTLLLSTL